MRFYVSPESISPDKNIIEVRDKNEIHHIRDVMRLGEGLGVTVFDGQGKEYCGTIKRIDRHSIIIDIKKIIDSKSKLPLDITLYQAIPKKTKMDFIIEKAVELGVNKIMPIITERTVPVIKEKGRRKKDRWERIAMAASKQCGRLDLASILDVSDFDTALSTSKQSELILFAALDKDALPFKDMLKDARPKSVSIFVGPEGDFSQKEISMAKKADSRICSLGDLVLRVETAAIYMLSCLNYELRGQR